MSGNIDRELSGTVNCILVMEHVGILSDLEDVAGHCEQGDAQQVTYGGEIRYRRTIRVCSSIPKPTHQHLGTLQQYGDLHQCGQQEHNNEERGRAGTAVFDENENVKEKTVARRDQQQQQPRGRRVRTSAHKEKLVGMEVVFVVGVHIHAADVGAAAAVAEVDGGPAADGSGGVYSLRVVDGIHQEGRVGSCVFLGRGGQEGRQGGVGDLGFDHLSGGGEGDATLSHIVFQGMKRRGAGFCG